MTLISLLTAGLIISLAHFYIVFSQGEHKKFSISENAIATNKNRLIYAVAHFTCDTLFLFYSYRFYLKEQDLLIPFLLNMNFIVLDSLQVILPSEGKTAKPHYVTAYISWISYLLSGVIALFLLPLSSGYKIILLIFLIPALAMFLYLHINSKKLYPFQLAIVPLFVLYLITITIGAS